MELETASSFFPSLQIYKGTSPVCSDQTTSTGSPLQCALLPPHKDEGKPVGHNHHGVGDLQGEGDGVEADLAGHDVLLLGTGVAGAVAAHGLPVLHKLQVTT